MFHALDFFSQPLGSLDLALLGVRRLIRHNQLLSGAGGQRDVQLHSIYFSFFVNSRKAFARAALVFANGDLAAAAMATGLSR